METTKKLSKAIQYKLYFDYQEKLWEIQHDKMYWPKYGITTYEEMVTEVNYLNKIVRILANKITNN